MEDNTLSKFNKNALELELPVGEELEALKWKWGIHRKLDTLRAKEDFELSAKRDEEDYQLKIKEYAKLKEKRLKEDIDIGKKRNEEDRQLDRPVMDFNHEPMTEGHPITPEIYQHIMSMTYDKKEEVK